MNKFLLKIFKALVGALLPLIIDEIRKLIEAWLASPAATAKLGSMSISRLSTYMASDEFTEIARAKIDNLL